MIQPTGIAVLPGISRFETELDVRYINGRDWQVLQRFDYSSVLLERVLVIPGGFVTNFASWPRVFWAIWPPTGIYGKPAVVHDYLYRTPGIATKAMADRVLNEAMGVLGVNRVTRFLMFRGLQLAGTGYKGGL